MVETASVIATAQRLITANGRSVTFVEFNSTPGDVAKPWNGPTNPRTTPDSTLTVDAVFVPPSSAASLGLKAETSDLMKRSEQVMIVSPGASADLSIYQEIIDGSDRWKIVGTETLKPGDDVLLNYVGVRR